MRRAVRQTLAAVIANGWAALAGSAAGENVAHFQVFSVNGGCFVDPHEQFPFGDPDRFFRLAIFDAGTPPLAGCPNGCSGDASPTTADGQSSDYCAINTGCGLFGFATQEVAKVTANQTGAFFYFGLFDQDVTPDPLSDSLGDHWVFASGPSSGTFSNNNAAPYYPGAAQTPLVSACGLALEDIGDAGNYTLTYSIFFEDTTPPTPASALVANDDGLSGVAWDNDSTLSFGWTAASDVNSGIAAQFFSLYDFGAASYVISDAPISVGATSVNVCSSGCTLVFAPANGGSYAGLVRSRNGEYPTLSNAATANSAFASVSVDLVNPTTTFVDPPATTWLGAGTHTVSIDDVDFQSGLLECERRVVSAGLETLPFTTRVCDGSFTLGVGAGQACRDEGQDTCAVSVRSTDNARRSSPVVQRLFDVDFTAESLGAVKAATEPGGTPIDPGVPQPDSTPTFSWASPHSVSPIAGFSHSLTGTPDCTVDTTQTSVSVGPLPVGNTLFGVRAIDAAGNCGPIAAFKLVVAAPAPVGTFPY